MSGNAFPSPRLLAALFCLYAAIAVPLIALLMPPFQAADELAHAQRADEIASGHWIATRYAGDASSGGAVDPSLQQLYDIYQPIRFRAGVKQTRAMAQQAAPIHPGPRALASFPNTAIYPPAFYLPAAVGQAATRLTHLSTVRGMVLSRMLTGLASSALAAFAILCSGGLAPLLFATLTLPMSLALFAATSQDGPMIATAALAAALIGGGPQQRGRLAMMCGALCLVAMARLAYLPLCLLPLLLPLPARRRLAGATLASAGALGWSLLTNHVTMFRPVARQVAAQMHALAAHPGIVLALVRNTLLTQWHHGAPYLQELVGVLGWLDTPLPLPVYPVTGALLLLALLWSRPFPWTAVPGARAIAAFLVLGGAGAVFLLLYLSYSPVGGSIVEGVQGRYFLPLLPFLALAMPARAAPLRVAKPLALLFCLYPALSIVVTAQAIVWRYDL